MKMKNITIKADIITLCVGLLFFLCGTIQFIFAVNQCDGHTDRALKAGDLVQHKVHNYHGVVLWNNDNGPMMCVRFEDERPNSSTVWQTTTDAEWEFE